MKSIRGAEDIAKALKKHEGVTLQTLVEEMIAGKKEDRLTKLEKKVNKQTTEINNLRDQIVALRETVAGVKNTAEIVNQRTAGLMVFGR